MGSITVTWPEVENEHGAAMLWFASWLKGDDGSEGKGFYSGRGGDRQSYPGPPDATGLRIRRWPNEGLDAEYVDVIPLGDVHRVAPALDSGALDPGSLDFDAPQRFSRLELVTAQNQPAIPVER
jgi:hypothetical protein